MSVRGCCQKRLAVESVDWVKRSALTQCGWAFSNLLRAQTEQKGKERQIHFPLELGCPFFFLPLDFRAPRPWDFRLWDLHQQQPPHSQAFGLRLEVKPSVPLVLRPLYSDWIIPPAVLALQFADSRLGDFSASITMRANSYNKSPFIYIYLCNVHLYRHRYRYRYILLFLFLWRALIQ